MTDSGHVGSRSVARASAWLQEGFLERYVCWREACQHVRIASEDWRHAEPGYRQDAFFAYTAALDREESAARDYRDVAQQPGRPVCDLAHS